MDVKGKKVTVVGFERSGLAACSLLLEKGARVNITDCGDTQTARSNVAKIQNEKNIERIELGKHTPGLIVASDLVVASPGVAGKALPISWAKNRGIPVIGEMELAYSFCPAPIIAITGTNGKTTVTTVVGEIFKAAGRKCVVCGNIGNPFSAELKNITSEHTVILEVSSFQLETINKFKPKAAAVLNLTPDHLDRYSDFNEYLQAKQRIFLNQDEGDWAVLNGHDPYRQLFAQATKARVVYFSKNRCADDELRQFNSNYAAACLISSLFGIAKELAVGTCQDFMGLEHRLEALGEIDGVRFINDSKATNVDSTLWALDAISSPIILIAGGRDKGSNFAAFRQHIGSRLRAMLLLGEAKEKIRQAFEAEVETKLVSTLAEAVQAGFSLARPGDCVLFSPMCASFDMFSNYAERGRVFKQEVLNLAQRQEKLKSQSLR